MPLFARTILITAVPDQAEPAVRSHREHLRELRQRGKLRVAGELGQGDGFLEILDVKDLLEAEELARESPLVASGLATWMIREWTEIVP